MTEMNPLQLPSARIWLPNAPWDNYVRAFIMRDTRGCNLAPNDQLNRFPALPYCIITWYLEGEAELVSCGGQSQHVRLGQCVLSGCQSSPVTLKNCGDVHKFMVPFHPDVFHALFGINLAPLHNQFVNAREVLPLHALELIDTVFIAQSDEERQEIIKRFLFQHLQAKPVPFWTRLRNSAVDKITLASASAMHGVGPRQLQRIALRETGLNFQTLIKLWRSEYSHLSAQRLQLCGKTMKWADHAVKTGYAAQSHWGSDCKAHTGRAPTQLSHDVWTEEADWFYRLEFSPHSESSYGSCNNPVEPQCLHRPSVPCSGKIPDLYKKEGIQASIPPKDAIEPDT